MEVHYIVQEAVIKTIPKKKKCKKAKWLSEEALQIAVKRREATPHRLWAMFSFLSGNRKESVSTANTEYQTHNITLITTTTKTKMNTSLPPRYHVSDI